jgi:cAMP phosphodiesterase
VPERLRELLQFWQAIDNSQPYLISHLHLHHFGGEVFTNPISILQLKLNLSATSLNQVKEQQVRDVLQFIVTRVRAQVQDLGHRSGSSSIIKPALFIAESSVVPQ